MDCPFLAEDGSCKGLYHNFGCIGDKCQVRKKSDCQFLVDGFYCSKHGRFGCPGQENCDSLEDYLSYFKREDAQVSV